MKKFMIGVFVIAFLVALLFTPFAVIWSLNTLFLVDIPYNIQSYLAVVILNVTWMWKGVREEKPHVKFMKSLTDSTK